MAQHGVTIEKILITHGHGDHIGDTVEARVTVTEIDERRNIVTLETVCTNQDGKVLLEGVATVMPPK